MASDVTIHCQPHVQIALPPICCYCREPATTTYPVFVWLKKLRTGPFTKLKLSYPIQVPYCATHGRQARLFGRVAADQFAALCKARIFLWSLLGCDERPSEAEIITVADEAVRTFLARYGVPAGTRLPADVAFEPGEPAGAGADLEFG